MNPEKLYFSSPVKVTKLELVQYYLSVAPGALAGIQDRPIVLKRFVNGAEAEAFYQKRAPEKRPAWLRTVTLSFPSGRTAEEIVVDEVAGLAAACSTPNVRARTQRRRIDMMERSADASARGGARAKSAWSARSEGMLLRRRSRRLTEYRCRSRAGRSVALRAELMGSSRAILVSAPSPAALSHEGTRQGDFRCRPLLLLQASVEPQQRFGGIFSRPCLGTAPVGGCIHLWHRRPRTEIGDRGRRRDQCCNRCDE
jgi:hypothetical protein